MQLDPGAKAAPYPRPAFSGLRFMALGFLTLIALVIIWLSLSDSLPKAVRTGVHNQQLLAHFSMHFVLALGALLLIRSRLWLTVALLAFFAAGLEFAQVETLTRTVSLEDLMANLIGTTTGVALGLALRFCINRFIR